MGRKKSVKQEMRVRRLRRHKLGMNGSQLINPEKFNFWKENLFAALHQWFWSLVGKQIFEQLSNFLTQPHNWQIDAFSCWIQLSGPMMALLSKGAQLGNDCLSLPPPKRDLLQVISQLCRYQPGPVSCVPKWHSLIPITWESHGHTRPHFQALTYEAYPSWSDFTETKELFSTETQVITIFSWSVLIESCFFLYS